MKKKIILTLLVLSGIAVGVSYLILNFSYSTGNRSGKLVKLSRKGFFPKTYEGTLDLGSGDMLTWQFSIHNNDLARELEKQSGKFVVLEYRELLWKLFYGTKYDVVGWRMERKTLEDLGYLCRLVEFIRDNKYLVDQLRPILEKQDPELLEEIRNCQRK